jgi:nucleoside-diphosphate-sugar epimerase
MSRVLVVGGAGYVGTALVRTLNYSSPSTKINVLDTFWFWDSPEEYRKAIQYHPTKIAGISLFQGDIRNTKDIRRAMRGCDQVINLACVSNDPSSDLDPKITHEISFTGNQNVILSAVHQGVERFIHASTSSVYGVKEEEKVTEDLKPEPITQYSKIKTVIEKTILHHYDTGGLNPIILRPATVCGYSPRQRLDLVLNIFCQHAWERGEIRVHGGSQFRPNINIADMVNAYILTLNHDLQPLNGQIFNVGDTNYTLLQLATMVRDVCAEIPFNRDVQIIVEDSTDQRSYRLDSTKFMNLGWKPTQSIKNAVIGLLKGFSSKTVRLDKTNNMQVMKDVLGIA